MIDHSHPPTLSAGFFLKFENILLRIEKVIAAIVNDQEDQVKAKWDTMHANFSVIVNDQEDQVKAKWDTMHGNFFFHVCCKEGSFFVVDSLLERHTLYNKATYLC